MTPDLIYRKRLEREIEAASWKRGFSSGPNKSKFELKYLESQLLDLCEGYYSGELHPWEFQRKAMTLHSMLNRVEHRQD